MSGFASKQQWLDYGRETYDCSPPASASLFWRLPIIRHARTFYHCVQIARWYSYGPGAFGIPTGFDGWCVIGMKRGWL